MYPGKEFLGLESGVYRLVRTAEEFEWFYERARRQPKLCVDTETNSLSWVKGNACGVVIGWGQENNFYISLDHKDRETGERLPDQIDWLDVYPRMKLLLENPDLIVYGHNLKFDLHMLANLGVWIKGPAHDSLIGSFLLDENIDHSLKFLSTLYIHPEADKWEKHIDVWRVQEARRRKQSLNGLWKAKAQSYKVEPEYMSEVTRQAVVATGFMTDENGKAPKGAKAALTRMIGKILLERAKGEYKDHLFNKSTKEDVSYDFIPIEDMFIYACADVHYTWNLVELLLPLIVAEQQFFDLYINEMVLCRELFLIERNGVKINREYLEACGPELEAEAARLEKVVYAQLGYEFNIKSGAQLISALQAAGCDLTKLTKGSKAKIEKTGNMDFAKFSTDNEVLEELGAKYEFASNIVAYRRCLKIKGTYVEGILDKLDEEDFVHCWFNQNVKTGRLSARSPNLTNIDGKDTRIRRSFTVPRVKKGEPIDIFVFMDLSQIELRLTAHESQDPELLACYPMEGKGKDVHSLTCAEVIMGIGYDEFITNMNDSTGHDANSMICECNSCIYDFKRKIAKRVNFGIIYGAGQYAIQRQVSTPARYVSPQECKHYIDGYLFKYEGVKEWIDRVGRELKRNGFTQNAFGRYRRLPDILTTTENKYKFRMMRQAVNYVIQGGAADMFKIAINRIAKLIRGTGIRIVNIVHDEIQFYFPPNMLHMIPAIKAQMEDWPQLSVPIKSDVSYSLTDWATKTKFKNDNYEIGVAA